MTHETISMTMMWLFVGALLLNVGLRSWLNGRQARFVQQHRHQVPSSFVDVVDLETHQKAADYTLAKGRLAWANLWWDSSLLIAWTLMGGLNTLNQILLLWFDAGLLQQLVLIAMVLIIHEILSWPLTWWQTFRLEESFGFNQSTQRLWWSDQFKSLGLGLVLMLIMASVMITLMHHMSNTWWLWAWAALVGFNALLMWIFPIWIAPLFNQFTPLDNPELHERITQLMQQSQLKSQGLFVMDGSRRSRHANAYFTGIGSAKRVVFFDTLLEQLNHNELLAVLAHELGHHAHRHIRKSMVLLLVGSLVGLWVLYGLANQPWFYTGLGVQPTLSGHDHALALILFSFLMPLFTFFLTPVGAAFSRRHEFEADTFAAQKTNPQDLITALLKLMKDNSSTLTPDPLYARFYHSHPVVHERIAHLEHLTST